MLTRARLVLFHTLLEGGPVAVQALYQSECIHRIVEIPLDAIRRTGVLRLNGIDFAAMNVQRICLFTQHIPRLFNHQSGFKLFHIFLLCIIANLC